MSQLYAESMVMLLALSYRPYATYSRVKTDNIITFAPFEECNLLSETHDLLSETHECTEIGNKYDDDSTMPPLISEEEMDVISLDNKYDSEPISTDTLEDICEGIQPHPIINRREARYNICDRIKQSQA